MADHLTPELREALRDLAELRSTGAALDATAPREVAATDRSGAIRAVLDPDGLPESLHVAPDWQRTLGSERLGGAVAEACQAAVELRSEAWAEALRRHGGADADRPAPGFGTAAFSTGIAAPGTGWGAAGSGTGVRVGPEPDYRALLDELVPATAGRSPGAPRPLHQVIEELLDITGDPHEPERTAPATATGVTAYGKVTLELHPGGTVSCTVDPHWAADLRPDELADALNRSLTSARAELATGSALPSTGARLAELSAELLAGMRRLA
ncbi:hypothetical protein [Plantactinospora sp. KLBMP9567]|uniref:hypothetical protein n=1 Tax=Plantactinospora sp. KLBMP9567 TaxID=3085900 RepID=UPI0029811B5A|nr:hypothetical protein [Plantactinospora sp. KLBMP9567]MDW5327947.1 hypothetical protein [Plantactinospora sp. KLBMP9567]